MATCLVASNGLPETHHYKSSLQTHASLKSHQTFKHSTSPSTKCEPLEEPPELRMFDNLSQGRFSLSVEKCKAKVSDLETDVGTFLRDIQLKPMQSSPDVEASERFACGLSVCRGDFFQKTRLKIHRRSHITLNKHTHKRLHTYPCRICGKRFVDRRKARAHEIVHNQYEHFVCRFKIVYNKFEHFVCRFDDCGRQYTQLGNLKPLHDMFHGRALRALIAEFTSSKDGDSLILADRGLLQYLSTTFFKPKKISRLELDGSLCSANSDIESLNYSTLDSQDREQCIPTYSKDPSEYSSYSQSVKRASIAPGFADNNGGPYIGFDKLSNAKSSNEEDYDGNSPTLPNSQYIVENFLSDSCLEYDSVEANDISESETSSEYFQEDINWDDGVNDQLMGRIIREYTINDCKTQINDWEGWGSNLSANFTQLTHTVVERIMDDFWVIFNQDWTAPLTSYAHTPRSSFPPATQNRNVLARSTPSSTSSRKRSSSGRDDDSPGDDEVPNPKKPNLNQNPYKDEDKVGFACPFRKHNPKKYDISSWRSCALSRYSTIARLKEHLYRRHLVRPQCSRCWEPFEDQIALDNHLRMVISCELRSIQQIEGITPTILALIRTKKRTQPNQSEEGKWGDMYHVLFPYEAIPTAYFEPIQENRAQSPNSQELASYEGFLRQELPRVFRRCLEAAVVEETNLLEEKFRNRLVDMMKDCQDQVLENYQSKTMDQEATAMDSAVQSVTMMDGAPQISSTTFLADFFQQPPQQDVQYYTPDLIDIQLHSSQGETSLPHQLSESGYVSMGSDHPLNSLQDPTQCLDSCGCCDLQSFIQCYCHCHLDSTDSTFGPALGQPLGESAFSSFVTSTIPARRGSMANITAGLDTSTTYSPKQSRTAKLQPGSDDLSPYDAEGNFETGVWEALVNNMPLSRSVV